VRGHRGFQGSRKIIQVFSSPDPIEEIDIGDGITPRPTFINKNMSLEHKDAIMKLLKDMLIALSRITVKCPNLAESW
jgi:hypothetical protein